MLDGQTALIVEDEFLIALDIQRLLETFGIEHTLFARNAAEADQLRNRWPEIAIAIIEISLDDEAALALVDSLGAAGIRVVLTTADMGHGLARPDRPILVKPVPEEALANAIRQAVAER